MIYKFDLIAVKVKKLTINSMSEKTLTVVIPAYNEGTTIKQALYRVFKFVPEVYEVIVVDDASSDDTAAVCQDYARTEIRVKLLKHSCNQGKTAALRTGFAKCSAAIVVVQDEDLEYDPRDISRVDFSNPGRYRRCLSGLPFHDPPGWPSPLLPSLFGK
jgi:glycosyltransferase involved in cell wall biosynthesis